MIFRVATALFLITAADAAAPTMKPAEHLDVAEHKEERQVRSSPEVMSMAVQPDGAVTRVESSHAPEAKKIEAHETEAKKIEAHETEAKTIEAHETEAKKIEAHETKKQVEAAPAKTQEAKPHIIAASAPDESQGEGKTEQPKPQESQPKSASEPAEETWKSAFFFSASVVLMVVLVGMIVARIYFGYFAEKKDAAPGTEKAALKSKEATASAAALQQHLNDSSSTSDSGEKIAMLFDRVRKSLEDLSHEKVPSEQADVAGQGQAKATNTL